MMNIITTTNIALTSSKHRATETTKYHPHGIMGSDILGWYLNGFIE